MALPLIVNGVTYRYPETGDVQWGPVTTQWAQAITNGMLQKAGGVFTLTADVDFGGNFGLISKYYTSRSADPAQSGALRLSNTDFIAFRNQADTADLVLNVVGDALYYEGFELLTQGVLQTAFQDTATIDFTVTSGPTTVSANIVTGSITNAMINASAAIARSKLDFGAGLVNADLASNAAIAFSKMAALSSTKIVITDGSGVIAASSVSNVELANIVGGTSPFQGQIDGKLNLSGGTMLGSLVLNADPTANMEAATKQYVDSLAQGLKPKAAAQVATTGSNITLFGEQTIDGVLTSNSRVLVKDQTDPTTNGVYNSNAGGWTRTTDMDTWIEFIQAYIFVSEGTLNGFSSWVCTAQPGGTLGLDPITWNQFSVTGTVSVDGEGLTMSGTVISLELDGTTLSKSPAGLKVATGGITNNEIDASAAIDFSKMANLTINRALVSDASGDVSVSAVTSTELGYVSGVTSAIQTQINSKLTNPLTTTGDMIYSSSGTTPARRAIGTTGQYLRVAGGLPTWVDPVITLDQSTISGTLNLTAADSSKVFLIDTSAARTVNLPTPAAGVYFIFKDKTGQCATNNITINRAASEQIEGVSGSKVLQTNWGFWKLMSDGTNWFIVG